MSLRIIKRNIKFWFQRRTRGWSDDETWNLDYEFIKWINSRFKKYKELSIADMTFNKFKYKKKRYTQLELIDKEIELTDNILKNYWVYEDGFDKKEIVDEIFDIFKLIFWTMWW